MKRKPIGNSKRFKVFERDGYTCRYCGSRPPEGVLEVDHFIPVKEGGDNEMSNLLTSCKECNQGKKARISRSPDEEHEFKTNIADKKEIIKQLSEITKLNNEIARLIDFNLDELDCYWSEIHDGEVSLSTRGRISVRNFLRYFDRTKIQEAMELAVLQSRNSHEGEFRYMCGILQNWKKGITTKPANDYE